MRDSLIFEGKDLKPSLNNTIGVVYPSTQPTSPTRIEETVQSLRESKRPVKSSVSDEIEDENAQTPLPASAFGDGTRTIRGKKNGVRKVLEKLASTINVLASDETSKFYEVRIVGFFFFIKS